MPRKPGAIELTDRRTWNAKHYRNPDGTGVAEFSTGSVHYRAVPNGPWLDKRRALKTGPGTKGPNNFISDEADVTMETWQTGTGPNRRWQVEFRETLTSQGIRFELTFQPTASLGTPNLSYTDAAARPWTYTHTRAGSKMSGPTIGAPQGPQTFSATYTLVGGAPPLTPNADGSVSCGNVFRMPRPYFQGADGDYPASGWNVTATTLSFSYDDSSLPASAFPYQIDPTTSFAVTAGANDGHIVGTNATYASVTADPAQSTWAAFDVNTHRSLITGTYQISNGECNWDTSSLDDAATLTGATFRCYNQQGQATDGRSVTMDWLATYTATTADFTVTPGTNAHAGTALSAITQDQVNDYALNNAATNVSKTGSTALRFHISGGQPTGQNRFTFDSFENTRVPSNPPTLIVDSSADAPSIRSSASGTGTGTTVSPTLPTGWAAGDLVAVQITFQGGSGVSVSQASGSTFSTDATNGRKDSSTIISQVVYYRQMLSGDSAPVFTLGSSQKYVWTSAAVAPGAAGPSLFDKMSGQVNIPSTTVSAPTLTPAANNALLLFFGACNTGTTFTPPSGWTERQDAATGTATGGTAAVQNFYLLGTLVSGQQFNLAQQNGTAPTLGMYSVAQGWNPRAGTAGTSAEFYSQTERAFNTFDSETTNPKPLTPDSTNGNGWRSNGILNGVFANANWTVSFLIRSTTLAWDGRGRMRYRLFASTDPSGQTGRRELTGSTQVTAATTAALATTGNPVAISGTWAPGGTLTFANEYLFVVAAFEVTTAGTTGNNKDVNLGQGSTAAITTSTFTPALDITGELADLTQTTAAATGTVSATAGTAALNIGQLLSLVPDTSAVTVKNAAVSISGTSSVSPAPITRKTAAVAVSGTASVAAAPITRKPASVAASGSTTVTPAPITRKPATIAASGSATALPAAITRKPAALAIAGAGNVGVAAQIASGTTTQTLRTSFPTPPNDLALGERQTFEVTAGKSSAGAPNPTVKADLYEAGTFVEEVIPPTVVSSTTGTLLSGTWDAAALADISGADVEILITATATSRSAEIYNVSWKWETEALAYTVVNATVPISGAATVAVATRLITRVPAALAIAGSASVSATPVVAKRAAVAIAGAATVQATPLTRKSAAVSIFGVATVAPTAEVAGAGVTVKNAAVSINGAATVTPAPLTRKSASVAIAGAATLSVSASALTAVGVTLDLQWNTRAIVGDVLDLRWNVREIVGGDLVLRWRVRVLGEEALYPDAILSMSGFSGTVADIRDDPDDPSDTSWLLAVH